VSLTLDGAEGPRHATGQPRQAGQCQLNSWKSIGGRGDTRGHCGTLVIASMRRRSTVGYDPEATRARILKAAAEEFAQHGSAGARVDRIAAKAEANKESIYRYYGSKKDLLARVLDEYLRVRGDETGPDPDNDAVAYPSTLVRTHAANPLLPRLLAWEGLEGGGAIDERSVRERQIHYDRKLALIEGAQRTGEIDPGLDPRHLLLAFLGMANWLVINPQTARMVFGRPVDDEMVEAHAQFLLECSRRIAEPREDGAVQGRAGESGVERVEGVGVEGIEGVEGVEGEGGIDGVDGVRGGGVRGEGGG
jgi:AcrR family transcriptional regulator